MNTIDGLVSWLSTSNFLAWPLGLWAFYLLAKSLYNISPFHPLYHVPGPWLSAATYLPEFYYDVVKYGRYTWQIKKMHEKYGRTLCRNLTTLKESPSLTYASFPCPIVRINPDELHCNDTNFVSEIFAGSTRKRDKPRHQVNGLTVGRSAVATTDHDLHRKRRAPLARYFSRNMIFRLEDEIHNLVQKLCNKTLQYQGTHQPIDVTIAYSCFTTDVISGYCFGESLGLLEQSGWYPNFRDPTIALLKPAYIFRFFPFVKHLIGLGEWFIHYLPPDAALVIKTLKIDIPNEIKKAKNLMKAGWKNKRPTVLKTLLESELEGREKDSQRLTDDATALIGGGTETVSWALTVITYHLLSNCELMSKLTDELRQAVKNPQQLPSWTTLEKMPYLSGVIQEGLRLSYGVSARTARIPTKETLVYQGEWNDHHLEYRIPPGYPIGMSPAITHHDERVFPDSFAFKPERWLEDGHHFNKELDRGMLAFSKGSRACLAKNLAMCELYLTLAALSLRVFPHMKLYETTERDVLYDHDMLIPGIPHGSKGVRVVIE